MVLSMVALLIGSTGAAIILLWLLMVARDTIVDLKDRMYKIKVIMERQEVMDTLKLEGVNIKELIKLINEDDENEELK